MSVCWWCAGTGKVAVPESVVTGKSMTCPRCGGAGFSGAPKPATAKPRSEGKRV